MSSSTLLVDDFFQAEDDRFLDELASTSSSRYLAGLAERWEKDPRPWARAKILEYLERPMSSRGHHPLVKRLFRHAEVTGNDVLVGAFLVAFDRLLHRVRRKRHGFDWQTRTAWEEEGLVQPRGALVADSPAEYRGKQKPARVPARRPKHPRLFTVHTRRYLQRRAWRYFRHMGFREPERYRAAISGALARYRDADLERGENILDSWGLMQALFRRSPALEFKSSCVALREGSRVADLVAAPRFAETWESAGAAEDLLGLVVGARSKLVRMVSIQLLKKDHDPAMRRLDPLRLVDLLDHSDPEVAGFGAGLVTRSEELAKASIPVWLRLLETRNLTALQQICDALADQVRPDRLDVEQMLSLTLARPAPVAQLGFRLLSGRFAAGWDDVEGLSRLAGVRSEAVARDITRWALGSLGKAPLYQADHVVCFFDSAVAETRKGAWDWLVPGCAGWDDPSLWNRLLENPHEDVRLNLVDVLDRRVAALPADPANLESLWTTVLLGVHRGSRRKPRALAGLVALLEREPERADGLLPVLALVARSIRSPERRQGIAALVRVAERRPELAERVSSLVPELRMDTP